MITQPSMSDLTGMRRCAAYLLLFLSIVQITVVPAMACEGVAASDSCTLTTLDTPALLGWNWFGPIESALSNRRRMIQMAVIGMCIGLYILMRR